MVVQTVGTDGGGIDRVMQMAGPDSGGADGRRLVLASGGCDGRGGRRRADSVC